MTILLDYFLIVNKFQQDGEEELGEVYQDEENGAALLIRKHPTLDKLVVVSTNFVRLLLSVS